MRLLLDTNIVIPLLNSTTAELPLSIRQVLERRDNQFSVSVASIWEIAIKAAAGKLQLAIEPKRVSAVLKSFDVQILVIVERQVTEILDPSPPTNDPFDRLLIAICQAEGWRLVTTDAKLRDHPLAWRAPAA